jgi:hypothetical protein
MAEWSKAVGLTPDRRGSATWVRIPLPPLGIHFVSMAAEAETNNLNLLCD